MAPPASSARTVALQAGRGLIQVLIGPDPAPAWRSPWQRRAVFAALTVATLLLCLASLASLTNFVRLAAVFTSWHQVTVNQVFLARTLARAPSRWCPLARCSCRSGRWG